MERLITYRGMEKFWHRYPSLPDAEKRAHRYESAALVLIVVAACVILNALVRSFGAKDPALTLVAGGVPAALALIGAAVCTWRHRAARDWALRAGALWEHLSHEDKLAYGNADRRKR